MKKHFPLPSKFMVDGVLQDTATFTATEFREAVASVLAHNTPSTLALKIVKSLYASFGEGTITYPQMVLCIKDIWVSSNKYFCGHYVHQLRLYGLVEKVDRHYKLTDTGLQYGKDTTINEYG